MVPAVTFQHHEDLQRYGGDESTLEFIDYELSANLDSTNAFEGPEKLLELWVSPNEHSLPFPNGRTLRDIPINGIEAMLDMVNCKILSKVQSANVDAYLLSESSLFVFRHKLILKTCGTTTTLFCLDKLHELINRHCGAFAFQRDTFRVFYSRRAFMFPHKQELIHQSWDSEVAYLNGYFDEADCALDVLGEPTGDHWYIYINGTDTGTDTLDASPTVGDGGDLTIEMLMTGLDPIAMQGFNLDGYDVVETDTDDAGHRIGARMLADKGLNSLYDEKNAKHDAFAFSPCGFSSNSLLANDGYCTLHVTPESGWSYASFETTQRDLQVLATVAGAVSPEKFVLTMCFDGTDPRDPRGLSPPPVEFQGFERRQFLQTRLKWYNVIYSFYVKCEGS